MMRRDAWGPRPASVAASAAPTGPARPRVAGAARTRHRAVAWRLRSSTTALPSSNGWAAGAGECTRSSSTSSARNAGDAAASGWTPEQTSCTKPGNVSSAERSPPPARGSASKTSTSSPASASTIAATSPFGPDPMTTARLLSALLALQRPNATDLPSSRDDQDGGEQQPRQRDEQKLAAAGAGEREHDQRHE